ncbi:PREDICTED: uncharacterized protein LOC106297245 [Brassica oleracea var. oleracea]|uniref:uncharacterized protein LOC106297245 n=1 Tax=Brassica oleracea var. oleracea TaxID=109376 RepID=UPI0006A6A7D7|nr:PREDICTED: uncharacterized protein LOC106297245 [Brassica oleracea var. oleracea]
MDELDGMIGPTRPFRELDRQMGELDIVVGPTRPFDELDGMIGHVQLAKWKRPYGPAPEAFADLTVADLRVNQHEDWDTEKIRRILPQYEEDILAIKPSNENALDRQVWRDAPLALGFDPRGIVDLESRWTALCATPCLPPTGLATSQLFPWILWTLWKERNRFVFNGYSASPEDTLATAIRSAKEWEQGHMIEKSTPPRSLPVTKETHTAATIVRSDAAWRKEDKKAGLGWTVKTSRFEIRMKKTQWHVSSPLIAEGLAIREAMLFCREHGLDNILLECDSSQLIRAINHEENISELHGILSDILQLSRPPDVSILFAWIPRNQNLVADSLSKEALCMAEVFIAPT